MCVQVGVMPDTVVFQFGTFTIHDAYSASDLFLVDGDIVSVKHHEKFLNRVSRIPSTL